MDWNAQALAIVLLFVTLLLVASEYPSWSYLGNRSMTPPDYWELPRMMGVMKGQVLRISILRDHPNKWHTCYNVKCTGNQCPWDTDPTNTIEFCYPAVIVTGMPKCGTSAMYNLLSRYTGTKTMFEKENCPYTRRRSHWQFFQTLPKADSVKPYHLTIDGCIDWRKNLMFRKIFRKPETLYIVMTRNYADMIWSAYNFWCKVQYDGYECDSNTKWVKPEYHNRSAEIFHDIVSKDLKNQLGPHESPLHDAMVRPAANAGGYFTEHIQLMLWQDQGGKFSTARIDQAHTMVVASEQLETDPSRVWTRVAHYFKMDEPGHKDKNPHKLQLGDFLDNRINAQDGKSTTQQQHGDKASMPTTQYKPGLFKISHYQPLLPETRAILDRCWMDDCVWVSRITGHVYDVCKERVEISDV